MKPVFPDFRRIEFSKGVREARLNHSEWCCEKPPGCGMPIQGRPEFHHYIEAGLGGKATFENCRVLCKKCHKRITATESVPQIAKADRIKRHNAGIYPRKQKIPSRGFPKWRDA